MDPGLPRLPPGRHGLPREFVVENQRDRLTAGIISTVAERGYRDATVTRICAAAGVSRRTFYSYFSSKEECYLSAFDVVQRHLTSNLKVAGREADGWAARVRARLEAMLLVFAANPDLVRFIWVAPLRAGGELAGRHRIGLDQLLSELTDGLEDDPTVRRPTQAIEQALLGGMMGLVVRAAEKGKGTQMQELLPDLVELILAPYIGRTDALALAGSSD